jgi:hypothetical protein
MAGSGGDKEAPTLRRAEVDVSGEFLDGLRWRAAHGEMAAKVWRST